MTLNSISQTTSGTTATQSSPVSSTPDSLTFASQKSTTTYPSAHCLPGRLAADRAKALSDVTRTVQDPESPRFFTIKNVIHPGLLKDMKLGDDFVVLAHICHNESNLAAIKKEGLKSVNALLAEGGATLSDTQKANAKKHVDNEAFSNDPSLIYFRPAISHPRIAAHRAVFIAVEPKSVFVFNQEHRSVNRPESWSGTAEGHKASAMTIAEYSKKLREQQPGTVLKDDKRFIQQGTKTSLAQSVKKLFRRTDAKDLPFVPECCLTADYLKPDFFISPNLVVEMDLAA